MIAIYARYGMLQTEEIDSFSEAQEFLSCLADAGEGYEIGIYDKETQTMYVYENMDIIGMDRETVLNEKKETLKKEGYIIDKIEFYASN